MTTQPQVNLRPGEPKDVARVADIWHRGWRDGHLGHVSDQVVAVRTADSFTIRAPDRVADTTVATVAESIAGFVMVVNDEVEQVYVDADFRGLGVADILLDEAETQVRDNGHAEAWLSVVAGNARARAFYQRRGWQDQGLFEYSARTADGGQVVMLCHRYTKSLA